MINQTPNTNKKYKVWVEIEEVDEEAGSYENVSPFPVCMGTFDSIDEADSFIISNLGKSSLR